MTLFQLQNTKNCNYMSFLFPLKNPKGCLVVLHLYAIKFNADNSEMELDVQFIH